MAARKLRVSRVLKTLQAVGGCRKAAAERLGVSPCTIDEAIRRASIDQLWATYCDCREAKAVRDRIVELNAAIISQAVGNSMFFGADIAGLRSAAGGGLVKAVETWDYRQGTPFRPYAFTVTRRAIIDEIRKQARRNRVHSCTNEVLDLIPASTKWPATLDQSWFYARITAGLDFAARVIVYLRFACDCRPERIADTVGLPVRRVRQILSESIREIKSSVTVDRAYEILKDSREDTRG